MLHFDRGKLLKHEITPEGYLNCYMRIAKVGELKYFNADGTEQIQIVAPEVLFDKASIQSFKAKPITLEHPPERVNSRNVRKYQRGLSTPYIVIDGDFLGVIATITDQETVDAILSKKAIEVSCGYDAEKILLEDGKYKQTKRIGNHIAITEKGRAGSSVRVQMDSDEYWVSEFLDFDSEPISTEVGEYFDSIKSSTNIFDIKKAFMKRFTLDGVGFETDDGDLAKTAVAVAKRLETLEQDSQNKANRISELEVELTARDSKIAELQADGSKMKGSLDALMAEKDKLLKQVDELQKKIDAMKKDMEEDAASRSKNYDSAVVESEIQSRLELWDKVQSMLKDSKIERNYKLDSVAIKKYALEQRYPTLKFDSADTARIDGAFEIAFASCLQNEIAKESSSKVDEILGNLHQKDSAIEDPIEKARKTYIANLENAWMS